MKANKRVSIGDEALDSGDCDLTRPPEQNRRVAHKRQAASDFHDRAALGLGLGRYLRAARLNAGLSFDELSRRADIDRVSLIALENGLLSATRISGPWLSRLASALREDVADLELLLGCPPGPDRRETAAYVVSAHTHVSPSTSAVELHLTYYGTGSRYSRDRHRAARPPRDPERLYFDK